MDSLRRIVLVGVALCLGATALLAQAQTEDGLAKQIAGLPWDTGNVGVGLDDSDNKAQIVVLGHFVNPHVTDFTGSSYIIVFSRKGIMSNYEKQAFGTERWDDWLGNSMCWTIIDGSGHGGGGGSAVEADEKGFDYHVFITWQYGKANAKIFEKTFRCRWVAEQTFKQDGFTITVTVKVK